MSRRQPLRQWTSLVKWGGSSKFCATVKFQVRVRYKPGLVQNLGGGSPRIAAASLTSINNLLPVYRLAFHPIPVRAHFVHPGFNHKSSRGHVGVEPLWRISGHYCNRPRAETIRRQFEIEATLVRPGRDPRLRPREFRPRRGAVLKSYAVPRGSFGAPPHPNPLTGAGGPVGSVGGEEGRFARGPLLDC